MRGTTMDDPNGQPVAVDAPSSGAGTESKAFWRGRFKQPASAREMPHRPRPRAVARRSPLTIALLALSLTGGTLWLSARSGMTITGGDVGAEAATAMERMDMMMTSGEHEEISTGTGVVDPAAVGLRVEWSSDPMTPDPEQSVTLTYRVVNEQSGEIITDLPLDHERPMHLILVSHDLEHFQHIHPELGADGTFRVRTTLPAAGTYLLYDEFTHDGHTVLDQRELVVGEASTTAATLEQDLAPKTVRDVTVAVNGPEVLRAGEITQLTFTLSRENQPITDLAPYLGAAAHVAIVAEDADGFAHTHGEAVATEHGSAEEAHGSGDDGHAVPAAFGPEVRVEHTFPEPGRYKIWTQFSHKGQVVTAPFTVEVR